MLKKLRIKFIALNMVTVALVLVVVFSAICAISHQQNVNAVYEALGNALSFTEAKDRTAQPTPNGQTSPSADENTQARQEESSQQGTPPQIGGKPAGSGPHVPIAIYSVESDGSYTLSSAEASASIADDVLAEASDMLKDTPDGSGELEALGLFYEKRTSDAGQVHLAFADVSAASGWQTLALTLAGVGVAALAVFFVISVFFSRWALRPVKQAWDQQRQFVADASHELKTPLTVILANTSILMAHPERTVASQSQWVESTQAEGTRMQGLVADLLLLARIDAEETDIVKPKPTERIDFSKLVEGELLQFESVAFERNIALDGNVDEGAMVVGNAERLRRLATTLLDNACKYADEGGTVSASLARRGNFAVLAVYNSGSVISKEDLPHVFDRFYRADKARTSGTGGYGLGLSIAREVAEEHGGTISASSSPEAGTLFTAKIPLA